MAGKRIRYGRNGNDWMQVVGIIADIRHYGLDGEIRPSVVIPYSIRPRPAMTIAMRGSVDASTLVAPAREVLRRLDAELPMYEVRAMSERLERSLWVRGRSDCYNSGRSRDLQCDFLRRQPPHALDRYPHGSRRAPRTGVARRFGRRDGPGRDRRGRGTRGVSACYGLARDHAVPS